MQLAAGLRLCMRTSASDPLLVVVVVPPRLSLLLEGT